MHTTTTRHQPYIRIDKDTGQPNSGQAYAVLKELERLTGVQFNFYPDPTYDPSYSYAGDLGSSFVPCSDTVNCSAVYFDASSSDQYSGLSKNIVLTAPVFQAEGGLLVHKTIAATSDWRLFEPFSTDLWGATIGFSVLTAFLMVSGLALFDFSVIVYYIIFILYLC